MPQQNGVLVVTGGSRGIGAATCLLGAERGYKVVVNYTSNVDAAERVCAQIHASGGEPGRVDRVKASVPMQRGGHPDEVAAAILWLLSDEASFVTGSFLDVAGGR